VAAEELARLNAISPHSIAMPLLVRSLARMSVPSERVKRMVETGMSELTSAVLGRRRDDEAIAGCLGSSNGNKSMYSVDR
jgi:hypothetical protein